jgi:putative colanic acid biosysnthesis UDP-glucose lipid carrier transferase
MASRLHASYVSILQRFCDLVAIYLGFYFISKINNIPVDNRTLLMFLSVVSLFQLIGGLTDFYRSWRGVSLFNELIFCLKNILLSVVLVSPVLFLLGKINLQIVISYFICVVFIMSALRVFIRLAYALFFKYFIRANDVLILGNTDKALKLFQDLKHSEWTGFNPIGVFSFRQDYDRFVYSGGLDEAMEIVHKQKINKVYVVINQDNIEQADQVIKSLADTTCSTVIIPELFSHDFLYSRVEDINGTPIIPIIDTRLTGINTLLKRIGQLNFIPSTFRCLF